MIQKSIQVSFLRTKSLNLHEVKRSQDKDVLRREEKRREVPSACKKRIMVRVIYALECVLDSHTQTSRGAFYSFQSFQKFSTRRNSIRSQTPNQKYSPRETCESRSRVGVEAGKSFPGPLRFRSLMTCSVLTTETCYGMQFPVHFKGWKWMNEIDTEN